MTDQLAIPDRVYRCDVCVSGVETDRETGVQMRCRVCGGEGTLSYDPAECAANPFAGLETQA